MAHLTDLTDTLTSFQAELNRIQTIAGTLSQLERQHYDDLTKYEDDRLNRIAVAEQSSARQLGEVKQICLAMAQKIEELQQTLK